MEDKSTVIPVGETIVFLDCTNSYTCKFPSSSPIVTPIKPCSINGFCEVIGSNTSCLCKTGYTGYILKYKINFK